MKTVDIYDSQFGNTERIAESIAFAFTAYGTSQALPVKEASTLDLEGIELVLFGSPTQAWKVTDGIRAFLARIPSGSPAGHFAASFDTRLHGPVLLTGSDARSTVGALKHLGFYVLVPAESFFVRDREGPLDDAETARAANWARHIHSIYVKRCQKPEAGLVPTH